MRDYSGAAVVVLLLIFALFWLVPCEAVQADEKTELTVAVGEVGIEYETVVTAAEMYMEENPDISIELVDSPEPSEERLSYFLNYFERESPEIDIFQIDVIWPGILAEHLVDLYELGAEEHLEGHFDFVIENNTTTAGELIAMPWFVDAGMLYYRADLLDEYGLDLPETWCELEEKARIIMEGEREENPQFYGYVWQGDAYEGLTTNVLEWFASNDGGRIVSPEGEVTVLNDNNEYMLNKAAGWIGDISPRGVTGFLEEDARAIWHEGNAAFMRNWPYAYGLSQESEQIEEFGVTRIPAGPEGESASALGGWHLGVSDYSENVREAAEFAFYLAGEEVQKLRAVEASLPPTIIDLYEDEEVLEANPYFAEFFDMFVEAVPRPSTQTAPFYDAVSEIVFTEANSALTGAQDPLTALENMQLGIEDILGLEGEDIDI